MGETEGETVAADARPSEEPEVVPTQDSLQVPAQKKRKLKSPTPGSLRGRSATPIRGRSQTPFSLYMTRRSATPSTWRSITPFLNREEKEKTPFELGRDIKMQTTCNIAVFDRALIMDISEPVDIQKPVRYITSDMSVIDRAAVMDVSNVEVIYVVEEYEEVEEEEIIEEVKPKKKQPRQKKGRTPRKSMERSPSIGSAFDSETEGADMGDAGDDREESVEPDESEEPTKKGKKKAAPKKKEKKEKSPSPKLTLKLEIGGGQKASKKMFEQPPAAAPKPPPKKSKLVLQMEEQAKLAAKAAEEEANRAKPKGETFEERQKRLQAEKEEQERIEAEQRAQEEAEAEEEAEDVSAVDEEHEGSAYEGSAYGGGSAYDGGEGNEDGEYPEDDGSEFKDENEEEDGDEAAEEKAPEKRRGSDSSDDFVRPDPYDEERWQRIAQIEGEEFMQQMRKYSEAKRKSEKERDADWQKRREQARLPHFINFLTDRTCQAGNNVRLACAVDGPELSVKWFKDGRQLERDATHRIINNNNILVLEVLNTTILDSGEYSCVIANMNDEVYSSCIVTIYEVFKDEPQPPSFRLIKEYYHLRDDELTIECHVHGVPRPIISWWRGPYQITPSYKFTLLEEAHGVCKLLIYKPSNKDSGIYICKAMNSSGEVQITHTVEVAKNRHYHVPGIFHARDRIQQAKGKEAKKSMDEAMKSMAESESKRAAIEEEQRARTHRATPEPMVSAKQKLKFATQLRDRMALEGTTVKFVCTVIGPSAAIRWMKDDKWVVVNDNIRNLSTEDKGILELKNTTSESSGVYKCVAKNDHCEIETSCYFKAYSARTDGDEHEPMFALPLRDVYHSSENDLIIDTKVRGNPRPKISWVKDNLPVVLDDRIVQIEHLDGLCELIINKPTPNDSGVYNCIAENKLGSQKITHTVVVEVQQVSRRSSILSSSMSEQDSAGKPRKSIKDGDKEPRLPKSKKGGEEEGATYERRSKMPDPSPKQQLYFTANLSNRYVAEGSKVKLQAVVGGPDPMLKWQKDGQNVTYGPRIRNMNREGLASLEFINAQPEDSGTYTIYAQNEWCKIETSAMLHVYQPKINTDVQPVFVRPLKDTYRLNTNELILETGVRGNPTPQVQWFKDSVEIERGGRFQILDHQDGTCELIIDYPSSKDSGKYVVKAENRAGKMEVSHYVLFEGKDHHIADNIHGVFHADKNLLRPKTEPEKPKPKEEAQPAAEGQAEDKKGKRRPSRRNKDESEDEGVSSATDYASDTGSLKKREKNIGIHFATYVKDRIVAEGSKIKLTCFLEAKEPQVKWFKNNEQIVNGPKIRGRYSEGLCLLEINSAALEDSGEYKCWARDESGEVSTTCKLEVYEDPGTGDVPPTFTRNIKDTYHGKINELQLDVHVRGLPTPTVTWVKDGVKIEPSEKYQQIDHDDGTCELFISNPVPADSGKYVCQAENREGKSEVVHPVTVEPRVRRPRSPPREPRPSLLPPSADSEEQKEKKGKKKDEETEGGSSRREVPPPPDLKKKLYFRNFLSNRTVKSGSNVKWMVNIDGPEPTAKWFHGDQPIAFGPKSKMSCQDGIAWLNLIGVTEEDAGEYTLRVRGPENEIISTCNLFVYSANKEELIAPTFTVGIKDTYSLNENELVLDCRVRAKPRPEIQWMKGNDMIESSDKYRLIDQADGQLKLIISNPTEKDAGVYSCVARNEVAENKISHQVAFAGRERVALEKTHGFFHRDPNKPHFLVPLGNQTVCNGGTVAVSAEFMQTNSPIEVHWFRNRQSVLGLPNVKTIVEKGVHTLTIMNATADVEGTYTCRASNAFGRIESHANVDVAVGVEKDERPPLFLSRPDTEMKIAVGDPFSISFRIASDPKPKLTFMKGTKDITKSDRVSKEVSDDYTRFTVQKSTISDSGTYFVVARNNFGTDRVFVTVTIKPRARSETPTIPRWGQTLDKYPDVSYFKDPPGPISTEPLLVDAGPTHLSLSWGKPIGENSAPVVAYRVDMWIIGHDGGAMWRELGLTPINSFDAFNLKSNTQYHFRVTPKNRYGWGPSVQTAVPLEVGGAESLPEFIKILPGQVKALIGSKYTLECTIRGAPRPEVRWYKDGISISNYSDRIQAKQIGPTCSLTFMCVCEEDLGRYSCEAINSRGRVSTFARLQVIHDQKLYEADTKLRKIADQADSAALGDALPIFTMRLRDRRVQVKFPVRLTCQIMAYPRPEVTWYKDDQQIFANQRCNILEDNQFYTLELTNTELDDSGIYTCTAKNDLGSISCHCNLVVDKGIRAYISPEFYMPLESVYTVQEGQEIRLIAKIEAYPSVGVTWHRNGTRIRPSRRIKTALDCNGHIELVITDCTERDAGIYVCVASNAIGKVESICRVVVEEETKNNQPPKGLPFIKTTDLPYSKEPLFVVKPRSSEAFEGDNVIIFCEVVGDPKPDVVWLRDFLNPEYYIDAPHFRRIGDGPEYRLEIPSAKLDFTGTYSIIAKNCHGEAKAVISLQIFAKDMLKQKQMDKGSTRHGNVETLPRFIHHLRDVRCCDGDAVTLECQVEAIPEPFILWEKDGKILANSKDFICTYNGIKAQLSIPRIYPEDEGEYTCVAKNTIGRTLSSACIIVDMPEEKENHLSSQLRRPGRLLSATPTPISTPRSTPFRSISPMPYSSREYAVNGRCSMERQRALSQRQPIAAPKFITIPYNRVVEEGESVRFQCVIYGNPSPWSTWDKNGLVVTPTERISLKEVDDLRALEIDEVTFEDAGLYRITLENDFGRIEATARLDVIRSSRYSKYSSGRSVRASSSKRNTYLTRRLMGPSTAIGGRMALAAGYRGSSVPSCKFYHNNIELNEDHRTYIKLTESEVKLFVDNVTVEDEGLYTCIIQSDDCPIVTSTEVSFKEKSTTQTDDFEGSRDFTIVPLKAFIEAEEYETVDILFKVNCSEPYTYDWMRNDEILNDSPEFNHIDHGNGILCLRINDSFDIDSGIYECIVKTVSNLNCKASCQLLVKQKETSLDDTNLMFIKRPLAVFTTMGSEATFFARVHPPNAEISWYICGTKISEDSENYKFESSTIDGSRILHIHNTNIKQSGEVQLSITYPGKLRPTVHTYTSLVVLPQIFDINSETEHKPVPIITTGPEDCTAFIGSSIELKILFTALPEATVQWFKGSREVVEDENLSILSTENSSTLRIAQIRADDSGKYSVNIMNKYGFDTASSSVAVEGPPDPPSGKPCVSDAADSILIAWCGPPYDGGCMLTGFLIEMQECLCSTDGDVNDDECWNSSWLEVATVVDSLSYTFKSPSAKGKFRFRVRAKNVHGLSSPGMPSDSINLSCSKVKEYESAAESLSIRAGGDFRNRFDMIEELGKGRFGVVYKVQEKEEPNRMLAAKIIKCIKSQDRRKVKEEISIMSSLKHPKLLQLAASFESPREIVMVMEYITGGELFERVVADDFTLTELDCILFMRQVCEGVAYMHTQSIVHLDLKPENIMCHTRNSHQIKIIDFGLAQRLNTDAPVRVLFGTPEFIPPEIISYEPIGFQSDMWSVGVICYVLLSGLSPFMGDTDNETFSNITRAEYDFDDDAFDIVSEEAKNFIQNLLLHRKEDRWSAAQCLESKWLTKGHDENLNNNKICTDKLKKFIIRRKWQKTGNAIRALGRMLNLSASRRNSAVSTFGSNPSSPRPSISGIPLLYPGIPTQMTSLFEEDDKIKEQITNDNLKLHAKPIKTEEKSHCSERSDSGYSECSNCSVFPLANCNCPINKNKHAAVQQSKIDETLDDTAPSFSIPCSLFNINFEKDGNESHSKKFLEHDEVDGKHLTQTKELNPPIERKIQMENKKPSLCHCEQSGLSKKPSSTAIKEPIMASDFTNTIKMRKKSLENNSSRGKVKQSAPIVYESKGRVSSLKSKFNCNSRLNTDACKQNNSNKCMDRINSAKKTATSSSTFNKDDRQTKSMPNSPLFLRSNPTIFLKREQKSSKKGTLE